MRRPARTNPAPPLGAVLTKADELQADDMMTLFDSLRDVEFDPSSGDKDQVEQPESLDQCRRSMCAADVRGVRKNGGIYVKRRADGRYLTHVVLPRILKGDIRRSFPQMICNVDNDPDPTRFLTFLDTFSTPNVMFHNVLRHTVGGASLVREFSIPGQDLANVVWESVTELIPDRCCHLREAQVRARSDGTGLVRCVIEFNGTALIKPEAPAPWQHLDPHLGDFIAAVLGSGEVALGADRWAPAGSPKLLHIVTTVALTLTLDSNKRIQCVHLELGDTRCIARYCFPAP